ncbi:Gfo/Idh/MocA family protein [Aestuariimicrobium ganziense]|uniref:Gfo/Idh/MocA family protein n=1 Tax=Aestuariimicrobium ganziense TaxID=2773677 RepID=UPI00194404C0|nr:Gfo/Idh/MocA family oxidoreductase [Aestuariimicrobium ganziense]
MKIAVIGAGQFGPTFANLWKLHPDVDEVWITDRVPGRAEAAAEKLGLDGVFANAEEAINSDVDGVAVITQRWLHHETVIPALENGKHVYCAVPMGITVDEIKRTCELVEQTGLTYMMGETSWYYPQTIYARKAIANGEFGRIFYAEGDYVHDMDNGFYAAYQYSGGENWKQTASYPPMLYPTHGLGGVLGAWPTHLTSVSTIGVHDDRGDGVFDKDVSLWGNDFSNMSSLYETADGGVVRHNEFRRVGHPGKANESRYRYYGTEGVMEQATTGTSRTTRDDYEDITELMLTNERHLPLGVEVEGLDPELLHSFVSGTSRVHDRSRLPKEYEGAPNGHEGSHHYLADDFVKAMKAGKQPPINAWVAARLTIPGIVALESARQGGARLPIPDLGDCPLEILDTNA